MTTTHQYRQLKAEMSRLPDGPGLLDQHVAPDPERTPAYRRTGAVHSGIQPLEAKQKLGHLLVMLAARHHTKAFLELYGLILEQSDPQQNGTLTREQALSIAKMTRGFIRTGDDDMHNAGELALNAAGMLLEEVLPATPAQQVQADQESRRMHEMRSLLQNFAYGGDELPF